MALGYHLAGRLSDDPQLLRVAGDLSRSLLATWGSVWALKLSVNAERPNGGPFSFPSGHTAASFASATVLARHYGWKAGLPAYALALFTGPGRMEDRRHYLSDLLFGAAAGLVLSREAMAEPGSRFSFDRISFSARSIAIHCRF